MFKQSFCGFAVAVRGSGGGEYLVGDKPKSACFSAPMVFDGAGVEFFKLLDRVKAEMKGGARDVKVIVEIREASEKEWRAHEDAEAPAFKRERKELERKKKASRRRSSWR